jgi:simple sugar transport system permease protein
MQSIAQTPLTLTTVLQALIVLFVAAPGLIHRILPFVKARRAQVIAPVPEGGLA